MPLNRTRVRAKSGSVGSYRRSESSSRSRKRHTYVDTAVDVFNHDVVFQKDINGLHSRSSRGDDNAIDFSIYRNESCFRRAVLFLSGRCRRRERREIERRNRYAACIGADADPNGRAFSTTDGCAVAIGNSDARSNRFSFAVSVVGRRGMHDNRFCSIFCSVSSPTASPPLTSLKRTERGAPFSALRSVSFSSCTAREALQTNQPLG